MIVDIPVEMPVDIPADISMTPRVASIEAPVTTGTIVMDASVSISFNIYRPYIRRPTKVQSSVDSSSHSPESLAVAGILSNTVSTLLPGSIESPVSIVPEDEIATDDKSDVSLLVVNSATALDEMENVKRRWFREEMRQSLVSMSE